MNTVVCRAVRPTKQKHMGACVVKHSRIRPQYVPPFSEIPIVAPLPEDGNPFAAYPQFDGTQQHTHGTSVFSIGNLHSRRASERKEIVFHHVLTVLGTGAFEPNASEQSVVLGHMQPGILNWVGHQISSGDFRGRLETTKRIYYTSELARNIEHWYFHKPTYTTIGDVLSIMVAAVVGDGWVQHTPDRQRPYRPREFRRGPGRSCTAFVVMHINRTGGQSLVTLYLHSCENIRYTFADNHHAERFLQPGVEWCDHTASAGTTWSITSGTTRCWIRSSARSWMRPSCATLTTAPTWSTTGGREAIACGRRWWVQPTARICRRHSSTGPSGG